MKKATRLALPLAVALTILLSLLVPSSYASPSRPASFNCGSQCSSWTYWNGTTYGGAVTITVSNPGFFSSPATWDRYMRLGSGNPKIIVGIFKSVGGGFGNYCSGAGSGLKYGVYGYDSSGFNDYNLCLSVPDSDVNLPMTMLVVRNNTTCNEGDGQLDEYLVQWSFNDFSNFTCVDNENPNGYNRMQLQEDITDSNVTGHQVWGSHWTGSSWVNVSDTFVNQSRGVDFLTARNPPQMFWYIEPAPGNNGGQMTTCVYDTGVGCNFGS